MSYEAPAAGTACACRIHGHMSGRLAEKLVGEDQAEWIVIPWTTRKGREEVLRLPAVRLKQKRSWKARPSGETRAKVKVMQLVN